MSDGYEGTSSYGWDGVRTTYDMELTYSPALPMMIWDPVQGDIWQGTVAVDGVTDGYAWEGGYAIRYQAVRETTVTVPAGTFDVVEIDLYYDGSYSTTVWYDGEVGLVKSSDMELQSVTD